MIFTVHYLYMHMPWCRPAFGIFFGTIYLALALGRTMVVKQIYQKFKGSKNMEFNTLYVSRYVILKFQVFYGPQQFSANTLSHLPYVVSVTTLLF